MAVNRSSKYYQLTIAVDLTIPDFFKGVKRCKKKLKSK